MRHTNYLLKPVTIDNAKPRDKAYALTDGGGLLDRKSTRLNSSHG